MNRRTLIGRIGAGAIGALGISGCNNTPKYQEHYDKIELDDLEIIALYIEYFGKKRIVYNFDNPNLNILVKSSNFLTAERVAYAKEYSHNSYLKKDVREDIRYMDGWLKS